MHTKASHPWLNVGQFVYLLLTQLINTAQVISAREQSLSEDWHRDEKDHFRQTTDHAFNCIYLNSIFINVDGRW